MPEQVAETVRVKVDVPFSGQEEADAYEKFVKETGKARGPWVRSLILKAMRAEGFEPQSVAP